tara:strand:+ start:3578 stop:5302 length:1725 start_codon:yes stop_codon:yes gene_type:complete
MAISFPKYFELIKLNKSREISENVYKVSILSNITVNYLKETLDYTLNHKKSICEIHIGDYDNIVQDSFNNDSTVSVIFWDLCNLFEGIHYKIEDYDEDELEDFFKKITSEINLVLNNLKENKKVFFNKFSTAPFNNDLIVNTKFDSLSNKLNEFLITLDFENLQLIEIEKIHMYLSLDKTVSLRDFYSSKSLYTVEFFMQYSINISWFFNYINGKIKKALILDCDNSLWGGIVGEDGLDGIKMSSSDKKGIFFSEVQMLCNQLINKGVIFGLCSKNNFDDVQKVIDTHKNFLIKDSKILIKKINWIDKASNLKEISSDLNIGIDSLVFVDDSDFEINLIKEMLPDVTLLQVPKKTYNYTNKFRKLFNYFYNPSLTSEDKNKTLQYKSQIQRKHEEKSHDNLDDYLASLEIEIEIFKNPNNQIERLSQMSLKTNQFNLTTKRYSETQISSFLEKHYVYSLAVKDKYGDSGITGLCIVLIEENQAHIDTFLLSCRVIGRKIEDEFLSFILDDLFENDRPYVTSQYIKSAKNNQVSEFYSKKGFEIENFSDEITNYRINLNLEKIPKSKFIKIIKNG